MWDVVGGGEVPKDAEERMEKVKLGEGVGESPLGLAFARRSYWRHWANEVHATLGLLDYDRQDPDLEEWERKASWDATVRAFERLAEEALAWEGRFGEEVFDVACPRFFIMEAMEKFTRDRKDGDTRDCEATVAYYLMHLYHAAGMAGGKVALALQYEAFSANALGRIEERRKMEGTSKTVEDEINQQAHAERPTRGKNIPKEVKDDVGRFIDEECGGEVRGTGWKEAYDRLVKWPDYKGKITQYVRSPNALQRIAEARRKDRDRKRGQVTRTK
jgi:hypothetical protein